MKRTFIAIKIYPEKRFLTSLKEIQLRLSEEKVKWTNPAKMHITLRFLGDTDEMNFKIISTLLSEIAADFEPFRFSIKGAGVFRNFRSPRVIWFGIVKGERIGKLKEQIDRGLARAGIPVTEESFKPHLTLGRIKYAKNRERIKEVLLSYESTDIQDVTVGEVIYYESELTPKGPVYSVISRHPFAPETFSL